MQKERFEIKKYSDTYREQILTIWEKSVLATHDFLLPNDFNEIKELVRNINFNDFQVFCLLSQESLIGFIGVADRKVEMLFLSPEYFGQGLGQKLLNFAVKELNADKVDVNEQNKKALKFYQKFGFETFQRTDKDDQGRNYPLLRMKLNKSSNEFWNFLGGQGTYLQLLDIFEKVGIELRKEIDNYFARYNRQ